MPTVPGCGAPTSAFATARHLDLVTVLATGRPALIADGLKSLLEDSGIEYLTQNEGLHDLFPVHRFRVHIQVMGKRMREKPQRLLADLEEE